MKQILLLSAGMLLAGSAQAQFGLKAGLATTLLSTSSSNQTRNASANARLGYQVGVLYEHRLTEHLSIVPEVAYSRQNMRLKLDDHSIADGGYGADYRLTRSYVTVPIMLRATFGKFYLEAGPQAGVLLAAHEEGTVYGSTIAGGYQEAIDRSATAHYRRFDVSLSGGLGLQLPAGFGIGLRTSTGLIAFNRENQPYRGDLKNQVVQASLTYHFKPGS
jgi:hypothetical protein